jgi:hypothetical protein
VTSTPPSSIEPPSGRSKPAIMRSSVVFPEPDGPSIVKNSPSSDLEVDTVDGRERAVGLAHADSADRRRRGRRPALPPSADALCAVTIRCRLAHAAPFVNRERGKHTRLKRSKHAHFAVTPAGPAINARPARARRPSCAMIAMLSSSGMTGLSSSPSLQAAGDLVGLVAQAPALVGHLEARLAAVARDQAEGRRRGRSRRRSRSAPRCRRSPRASGSCRRDRAVQQRLRAAGVAETPSRSISSPPSGAGVVRLTMRSGRAEHHRGERDRIDAEVEPARRCAARARASGSRDRAQTTGRGRP